MTKVDQGSEKMVNMGFTTEVFPRGTHMCYIYNDETERRQVMAQFINAGLAAGELVGYFADVESESAIADYLAEMGVQLPKLAQSERTRFLRAHDVYCPDDHFSPARMLVQLQDLHADCHTHGYADVRVTGEMSWALSPDVSGTEQLVEYESRINLLEETYPETVICQYNANRFDGATIFEILRVHPMMVVRGQVVRNPYYVPVREYLSSHGLPVIG